MEVRGVKAVDGLTRFSSDQRSLESGAVICSHSSAKHCFLAAAAVTSSTPRTWWPLEG